MPDKIKRHNLKTLEKRHSQSNISLYDIFSPIKRNAAMKYRGNSGECVIRLNVSLKYNKEQTDETM